MRSLFAVLPFVVLAGCGSGREVDVRNASAEEVAEKASNAGAGAVTFEPGKWKVSTMLEDISMSGMPPAAVAAMKSEKNKAEVHDACLTPKDVKKPSAEFFTGADKSCRYDRFTLGGGKIDAVMRCNEGASAMKMTMDGTYSSSHYSARMTIETAGDQAMKMVMKADATRVGQCTGKEEV